MVRISDKTQKRIKKLGEFGESYDDVINEALDLLENEETNEEDEDEEEDDKEEDDEDEERN